MKLLAFLLISNSSTADGIYVTNYSYKNNHLGIIIDGPLAGLFRGLFVVKCLSVLYVSLCVKRGIEK